VYLENLCPFIHVDSHTSWFISIFSDYCMLVIAWLSSLTHSVIEELSSSGLKPDIMTLLWEFSERAVKQCLRIRIYIDDGCLLCVCAHADGFTHGLYLGMHLHCPNVTGRSIFSTVHSPCCQPPGFIV